MEHNYPIHFASDVRNLTSIASRRQNHPSFAPRMDNEYNQNILAEYIHRVEARVRNVVRSINQSTNNFGVLVFFMQAVIAQELYKTWLSSDILRTRKVDAIQFCCNLQQNKAILDCYLGQSEICIPIDIENSKQYLVSIFMNIFSSVM